MRTYKLNKTQQEAVSYVDGPLLIVAGAGTGKTSVITHKIVDLIEQGLAKPEEILALTFTEKAAQEMQERVDQKLNISYTDIQISTFHSFAQRLLEQYGLDVGIPNHFSLFTHTEAWLLLKEHIYDLELDYYRPLGNPTKHIHEFLKHFSKCKDELITPEEYLKHAEEVVLDKDSVQVDERSRLVEMANAYHYYNQLLLKKGALDFGDLLFYAVKLLETRQSIRAQLQKRYKYILVDEFQDVNYAQYELVKYLAEEAQLTVVGDDDQSIYAFRGASVSNILRFKDDYPKAKEIVLAKNYRSAQSILDHAYTLVSNNNPDRLEVRLNINKKLTAAGDEKGLIKHLHTQTAEQEVQAVVEHIAKHKSKDVSWGDMAILVRANTHAEPFIEALESAAIPVQFHAASGLYRQPIVIDAFNILRAIVYPYNSAAIYRIMRIPSLQLPESDILRIIHHAKKKAIPYIEALQQVPELNLSQQTQVAAAKIVSTIIQASKKARYEKPSHLLYNVLESLGYLTYLAHAEAKGDPEAGSTILQLRQFLDMLEAYQMATTDAHVSHFVDYFSEVLESGEEGKMPQLSSSLDAVQVMTVHSSKGLEFEYVFMVNMVDDRFPTRRRSAGIRIPDELVKEQLPEGDAHYQEERRLCYVGMTRAKKALYFSSADNYGGVRQKKVSRFLHELDIIAENVATRPALANKKTEENRGKQVNIQQYELPRAFSFSQIKTYQTCPYKYKLGHVLKLPSKGSASFSFGQTIHATLHQFYAKIKELNSASQGSLFDLASPSEQKVNSDDDIQVPSLDELLHIYESAWIGDWYKNKRQREEYYQKGKEILKTFYALEKDNWNIPEKLESWFKIKIGDYTIQGRMDRVDQLEDGTLEIIDYKTGKTREKLTAEDKEQLLIYQIAATALPDYRNVGETSKLTFFYMNDSVRTSFVGSEKEIEALKQKITKTLDKLHTQDFTATPSKFVCSFCDFKEICEFRTL